MHGSRHPSLRTVLISALAAAAGSLTSTPAAADAFTHYEPAFLRQAERALHRDDPERALELVSAANDEKLKLHHRADAYGIACRAELALGRPRDAKAACEAALALDQGRSNWRFLNNLGAAELGLGNFDAAREAFSRAAARSRWAEEPRRNLRLVDSLEAYELEARGDRVAGELR